MRQFHYRFQALKTKSLSIRYTFLFMVYPTTIKVSYKVRNLLKKFRKKDQTYNDYIFEIDTRS